MRVYETAHDHCVLRRPTAVDGRSFLTSHARRASSTRPTTSLPRDCMGSHRRHVMGCGFSTVYGHTQSDDVRPSARQKTFGRKPGSSCRCWRGRARGSHRAQGLRPSTARVYRLRATRTSSTTSAGATRTPPQRAQRPLLLAPAAPGAERRRACPRPRRSSTSPSQTALLFARHRFNDIPAWQKRGVGVYWRDPTRAPARAGAPSPSVQGPPRRPRALPKATTTTPSSAPSSTLSPDGARTVPRASTPRTRVRRVVLRVARHHREALHPPAPSTNTGRRRR